MEMRRFRPGRRLLIIILVPLLAAGATFWFFTHYERRTAEVHGRMSQAARRNPLLAAERFLAGIGMPVKSHRGRDLLVRLPPAGDALVVLHMSGNLSPSQVNTLYDWIGAGGHLVMAPGRYTNDDEEPDESGLLARVGVLLRHRATDNDCGCDGEEGAGDGKTDAPAGGDGKSAAEEEKAAQEETVTAVLDGQPVTLAPNLSSFLDDTRGTASLAIADSRGRGAVLLQYRIGSGRLTVLNSMDIFTNSAIGDQDHAYLLAWLVAKNNRTWLLYSSNMESLLALLWRSQAPFLVALAATLLLALWAWQFRLGPLEEEDGRERQRNVLAHVDASGMYGWRIDRAASLLAANRNQVLRRWAARHTGRADGPVDAEEIASRTGLAREEVAMALFREVRGEQDLIAASHWLQQLENRTLSSRGGRERAAFNPHQTGTERTA